MTEHSTRALQAEIDALREKLAEITTRLSELDRTRVPAPAAAPAPAAPAEAAARVPEALPDETVAVIAAAVAAYLGERVRVRQIRLISSPMWAQQGRVSIQASHRLDR